MSDRLQALLQSFFTDRLQQQRRASPHTVASYRDTFRLLLRFATARLHVPPARLTLGDLRAPFIVLPSGGFPGFSGTTRSSDFLPSLPPRFVAFARRYQPRSLVRSRGRGAPRPHGPGHANGVPGPTRSWRRQDLPGSWQTPMHACRVL